MFNYEEPKENEGNKSEGIEDIKRKMKTRGGELKAEDLFELISVIYTIWHLLLT